MRNLRIYIIIALVAATIALFVLSGEYSPRGSSIYYPAIYGIPTGPTVNCSGVNLSFTYDAQSAFTAPMGTNTFSRILVNATGNVSQNISLTGSHIPQLSPQFGKPFIAQKGQQSFIDYGVYSPSPAGNYTMDLTLTSSYLNCKLSKQFSAIVEVANTSAS